MSSRSLNEILIKIPTELFIFIFAAYNLRFILPLDVYICTQRNDARRIQERCFIYCSIFMIPALRKRCVQGHCTAYHFRISVKYHFIIIVFEVISNNKSKVIENGVIGFFWLSRSGSCLNSLLPVVRPNPHNKFYKDASISLNGLIANFKMDKQVNGPKNITSLMELNKSSHFLLLCLFFLHSSYYTRNQGQLTSWR